MKSPTFTFLLFIGSLLKAQSPVNGFMQRTGNGSLVFSYNTESYNEVYLVPKKINTIPIFNHTTINSISVYATYGLSDKLNFVVNVPYIQTKGEASEQVLKNLNFENTRKGIQDISAYLKYKPLDISLGSGTFNLVGAVGIKTPLGNYKVDENLQSIVAIGNRATSLNTIIVGLFRDTSGFFVSGQVGYCLRNNKVPDAFISFLLASLAKREERWFKFRAKPEI